MKLTIQRSTLSTILGRTATVTKTKSPHPLTQNVLLRADAGVLSAAATDLYHSVSTSAPAEISEAGTVAVNCRDLLDRVKSLPEGNVVLSTDKDKLRLASGKRKHALSTYDAESFPAIAAELSTGRKLPANVLSNLFAQVRHAASTDVDRPQINAVLLELVGDKIMATTTDGKRLAHALATIDVGPPMLPGEAVVPIQAVDALTALLGADETLFSWDAARMSVRSGATVFTTQLTTGSFPNWRQIVPEKRNPMVVDRKELMAAVSSVQKASPVGDKFGSVELRIAPGKVRLMADGNGEAEDELAVEYEGSEYAIGMQGNFAIEAMNTLDADRVRVSVTDELDPVFFWTDGDLGFRLVMPCRLRDAGGAK
jgi:DNA polymerase-3 subunit beta